MAITTTLSCVFSLIILCTSTLVHAKKFGFSADLIHRDSPSSPFYDPSKSPYVRVRDAYTSSINRAKRFFPNATFRTNDDTQADLTANGGSYLMKIQLGTPPVDIVAIADTGSDLIWTQCQPCTECFPQTAPLFNPAKSSTYKKVPCGLKFCGAIEGTRCGKKTCSFQVRYGDESYATGDVATETVSLLSTTGKPVGFPQKIIGCSHESGGTFGNDTSGIIGLGGGETSLIKQLGPAADGKFSYCLTNWNSKVPSKISFGANAVVAGRGAVSTPIITQDVETFYYLSLEGVSVGNKRFNLKKKSKDSTNAVEGNIIIDSGTTLTLLPQDIYTEVEAAVRKAIKRETTPDPQSQFSLCYENQGDLQPPLLNVHFTGADITLNPINTFVQISEELVCFALIPADPRLGVEGIFGNIGHINFLTGYDLGKKTVTFKPTNCVGGK